MTNYNENSLQDMLKENYLPQDIQNIRAFLIEQRTFDFPSFDNGLFPAAIAADAKNTGYKYVWVRDNIYVAYSKYVLGQTEVAIKNIHALMSYFKKYKFRFEKTIDAQIKTHTVMERPNIRFDGYDFTEVDEQWEHAQNDALGYFLWLYCKLCKEVKSDIGIKLQADDVEILALFPLYFQSISYWEDEDSGHWEEGRKIEASSIGVVVAGLKALRSLFLESYFLTGHCQYKNKVVNLDVLDDLIERGVSALNEILPSECIQPSPNYRRYDGALLFLIYPLNIVRGEMAEQILSDITTYLQGEYGIRRYLNDSFWCRDFQDLPKKIQTSIYTDRQNWLEENGKGVVLGEEAQWCIFDPILSVIFGHKFQSSERKDDDLKKQTQYLNRSLNQITGKGFRIIKRDMSETEEFVAIEELKCPELYYIQRNNYIPNVSTPLLWTQANLSIALEMMEKSLRLID